MHPCKLRRVGLTTIFCLILSAGVHAQTSSGTEWKAVEEAMGRSGQVIGEVLRFSMPRKDLHITLGNVAVKPGLALGSWAAFKGVGAEAMVMGDLVLTEDEISPVMRKLQEGGIEISALHNHLVGESPHVMYMHIAGHGDPAKLAHAVHDALVLTRTPGPDAGTLSPQEPLGIDQKKIEEILERSGKV